MLDLPDLEKAAKDAGIFSLDTETTSLDILTARLVCITFAVKDRTWIVPFAGLPGAVPVLAAKDWLNEHLFNDPNLTALVHNAKFDIPIMTRHGFNIQCRVLDTMIAEYITNEYGAADPKLSKVEPILGLKPLVKKYFNIDRYDYDETLLFLSPKDFIQYARDDASDVWRLWHDIHLPALQRDGSGVQRLFYDIEMPLVAVVMEMESSGLYIDINKMSGLLKDNAAEIEKLSEKIWKIAGKRFNIASNDVLSDILFRELKIDPKDTEHVKKSTPSHPLYTTGKSVLKKLHSSHKIIPLVEDYRKAAKLQAGFLNPLLEKAKLNDEHRIYPEFLQARTVIGRFASRNPNGQNFPKKGGVRDCICAPPESVLVCGDLCIASGSRVVTTRGAIPIENIIPKQDYAIQEDGSKRIIKALMPRGRKKCVEIITECGYSLKLTTQHRIRIINSSGEYVWKRVCELNNNDYIAIQPTNRENNVKTERLPKLEFRHFNENKKIRVPTRYSVPFFEFVGYLLGDGCFFERGFGFVVCDKDKDVSLYLKKITEKLFLLKSSFRSYRGVFEYRFSSMVIRRWFTELGLCKQHVPEVLYSAPKKFIAAFLRGLFEADGSCAAAGCFRTNGQRISFCSAIKSFCVEVQELLLMLGIHSSRSFHKSVSVGVWILDVHGIDALKFKNFIGFLGKRKNSVLRFYTSHLGYGTQKKFGLPNQKELILKSKFTDFRKFNRLVYNSRFRGSILTLDIARRALRLKNIPNLMRENLSRFLCSNQRYEKIGSIRPAGYLETYDIEVSKTKTYIVNGFVSHNSQIEYRMLAHQSKDPNLIKLYNENPDADVHRWVADTAKIERDQAKTIGFGMLFGLADESLAASLKISLSEAKKLREKWISLCVNVPKYKSHIRAEVIRKRYVETIWGRRRRFAGIAMDEFRHRQAFHFTISGSAADSIKISMVKLHKKLKELRQVDPRYEKVRILAQIHDELLLQAPEDMAPEVAKLLKEKMEDVGKGSLRVPIIADVNSGTTWSAAKEKPEKKKE